MVLLEIYTTNEGSFSVGYIIHENNKNILFKLFDEEGKENGIYLYSKSFITSIKRNTVYLKKMKLYIEYWRENLSLGSKVEDEFSFDKCPSFSELISEAKRANEIITVGTYSDPDMLITGYVKEALNEKSLIQCIDLETAESFDKVYVSEQDITFLEIGSLENKLLRYANLRIEKLS